MDHGLQHRQGPLSISNSQTAQGWTGGFDNDDNDDKDQDDDAAAWCSECHFYATTIDTKTNTSGQLDDLQCAERKGGLRWGDLEGRHGARCQREPD